MCEWGLDARSRWVAILLGLIAIGGGSFVLAQTPAPPPVPEANPAPAVPAAPPAREALLEERLRKLEAMNQKILQQYEASERRHNQRYEKLSQEFKALQERLEAESARGASEGDPAGDGDSGRPATGGGAAPGEPIGPEATRGPQGTISRTRELPGLPGKVTVSRGFRWTSDDNEFQLVFHD